MPIDPKLLQKARAAAAAAGPPPEPKPRIKKADRAFSPPELGLRPSRFGIAEKLYTHYQRCRQDLEYADQFYAFVRQERQQKIADDAKFAEWLKKKRASDEPRELRVSASKIKDCARATVLQLMRFPEDPVGLGSPHWNIAALSGELLHSEIEMALKFLGLVRRSEFRVYSRAKDLSGIVDIELLGSPVILDIKTVGVTDFKEGAWGSKVPGYMAQISVYGRLTNNSIGVILLLDRGSGKMLDLEFDIDPDFADKMLRRATKMVEYAKERKLPKPEKFDERGKPSYECFAFCPFRKVCFLQQENGLVEQWLAEGRSVEAIYEAVQQLASGGIEADTEGGDNP